MINLDNKPSEIYSLYRSREFVKYKELTALLDKALEQPKTFSDYCYITSISENSKFTRLIRSITHIIKWNLSSTYRWKFQKAILLISKLFEKHIKLRINKSEIHINAAESNLNKIKKSINKEVEKSQKQIQEKHIVLNDLFDQIKKLNIQKVSYERISEKLKIELKTSLAEIEQLRKSEGTLEKELKEASNDALIKLKNEEINRNKAAQASVISHQNLLQSKITMLDTVILKQVITELAELDKKILETKTELQIFENDLPNKKLLDRFQHLQANRDAQIDIHSKLNKVIDENEPKKFNKIEIIKPEVSKYITKDLIPSDNLPKYTMKLIIQMSTSKLDLNNTNPKEIAEALCNNSELFSLVRCPKDALNYMNYKFFMEVLEELFPQFFKEIALNYLVNATRSIESKWQKKLTDELKQQLDFQIKPDGKLKSLPTDTEIATRINALLESTIKSGLKLGWRSYNIVTVIIDEIEKALLPLKKAKSHEMAVNILQNYLKAYQTSTPLESENFQWLYICTLQSDDAKSKKQIAQRVIELLKTDYEYLVAKTTADTDLKNAQNPYMLINNFSKILQEMLESNGYSHTKLSNETIASEMIEVILTAHNADMKAKDNLELAKIFNLSHKITDYKEWRNHLKIFYKNNPDKIAVSKSFLLEIINSAINLEKEKQKKDQNQNKINKLQNICTKLNTETFKNPKDFVKLFELVLFSMLLMNKDLAENMLLELAKKNHKVAKKLADSSMELSFIKEEMESLYTNFTFFEEGYPQHSRWLKRSKEYNNGFFTNWILTNITELMSNLQKSFSAKEGTTNIVVMADFAHKFAIINKEINEFMLFLSKIINEKNLRKKRIEEFLKEKGMIQYTKNGLQVSSPITDTTEQIQTTIEHYERIILVTEKIINAKLSFDKNQPIVEEQVNVIHWFLNLCRNDINEIKAEIQKLKTEIRLPTPKDTPQQIQTRAFLNDKFAMIDYVILGRIQKPIQKDMFTSEVCSWLNPYFI